MKGWYGRGDGVSGVTCGALRLVAVVALVAALAGCGAAGGEGAGEPGSGDGPLRVVATYSILGDMVENVGGEEIELTTLVGPDGDTHNFEPSPADNARLSEADLIFENGLGFETWMDDIYESSGSEAERVVTTENVEPLALGEQEHAEEGGHAGEHGEYDPHVWLDVGNAMTMVGSIRDALVEADPENAETYRANAGRYFAELQELDAEVVELTGSIPEENRKLVTSHDTFSYFAGRYGLEVVGTGLASYSTEAGDPSARETAGLVDEIEATGVPAIFAENISNPALMERIAAEASVELAPPLYTDALGEPGSEGATYVEMVRYDARVISEALRG